MVLTINFWIWRLVSKGLFSPLYHASDQIGKNDKKWRGCHAYQMIYIRTFWIFLKRDLTMILLVFHCDPHESGWFFSNKITSPRMLPRLLLVNWTPNFSCDDLTIFSTKLISGNVCSSSIIWRDLQLRQSETPGQFAIIDKSTGF